MWIGAHPDDESMVSGALLAKACADDKASCIVVSVGDGRWGRCTPQSITNGSCPCPHHRATCPDRLGITRTRELRDASWFYQSSSIVLGRDDLIDAEHREESTAELQALWMEHQPQLIVTHGTQGGYGHASHIWVNRTVVEAWRRLPAEGRPELYFGLDLTDRTVDDDDVTDTIDAEQSVASTDLGVSTLWELVIFALESHRTQSAIDYMRGLDRNRRRSSFHQVIE